jgi:type IV pilus assembly protein PilV
MRRDERGATLIEILVTIVIVAFGLLGLAGLQMRMQMSESEAYQRSQALMLLNDMASRIANNRLNTASYISSSNTLGTGYNCSSMSTSTQAALDLKEWCQALEGAGESLSGTKTGAMINGRGCIQTSSAGDGDIVVTVTWQGLTPISAPPSAVTCGLNTYNGGTGSVCTNDKCRRFVTTIVRIGTLT